MPRTLLVMQDSPQFGGHEVMFLKLLPAVLDGPFDRVVVRLPEDNTVFRRNLDAIASPRLFVQPWPFAKRRAEPYLAGWRRGYARAFTEVVAQERPSATLLLQGRIENLAVPMLAAPRDTFIVSYIPMAHSLAEMGRRGTVGDRVRRRLYRRPNRFIVPSRAVADQLARAGAQSPAVVVENVVDLPAPIPGEDFRKALNLPSDRKIALFLGRFDTGQKGLDLLLSAIRRTPSSLSEWTFVFVGDGPGRREIEGVRDLARHGFDVRVVPWTDRPQTYLRASDILLMPSRFEGVPLAMLEALACGVPVLASNIDVFEDYLPAENRVDYVTVDLAERLNALVAAPRAAAFAQAAKTRLAGMRLDLSRARFAQALTPERWG